MFKRSIRKIGIGTASFSLAVSVLFPSAVFAGSGSFLPASPDLKNHASLLESKLGNAPGSLSTSIQSLTSALHSKPQNYAGNVTTSAPVTFIVQLQNDPVKVAATQGAKGKAPALQRNILRTEHNSFASAAAAIGAVTGHEYTEVFNGYSVTLPGNQVDKLLTLPGVKAVFANRTVHTLETATAELPETLEKVGNGDIFGAEVLTDAGITGEGIKVAVIDTGIDPDHPYLKDFYVEGQGYDVVDDDAEPYETEPDANFEPINGNPYETAHGSHVSGIIKSVAPDVDLYVYRVLGPYGSGSTADVIEGIERAVEDEVDVINLSLGSDVNQQYSPDAIAVDNAANAGVTVVLAAGNAGPEAETVGTPGGAHRTISVAASSTPADITYIRIGATDNVYGIQASEQGLPEEAQGLEVVYAGLGLTVNDYKNADVAGKIALVDRGSNTFVNKSANARAAGAAGLLIANNRAGELNAATDATGVPTYGITKDEGTAIKAELADGRNTITFKVGPDKDNLIAGFSSRGPALPDFNIKPDVAAPGVGVNSSVPEWESPTGYTKLNGTSMASPHVAGAAALLLSSDKTVKGQALTPDQVKILLANNATSLTDRNNKYYSVYEQGAGLINLPKALSATAIARVAEVLDTGRPEAEFPKVSYDTGSLSFGLVTKPTTVTKTVYVDNLDSTVTTFNVAVSWRSAAPEGVEFASLPSSVTAGNYFNVPLKITGEAKEGQYEGVLTLSSKPTSEVLTLPFSVVIGEQYKPDTITNFEVGANNFEYISPNGDGFLESTYLTFSVNETVENLELEVVSLDNSTTVVGDVYATGQKFYPGLYEEPEWKGTVVVQDTGESYVLPDGIYSITPVLDGTTRMDDLSAIVIIDREAPEVAGATITENPRQNEQEPRSATISGVIAYDLMYELIDEATNPNELLAVAAAYEKADGTVGEANGYIGPNGYFEIEVPLAEGLNQFYLYAYDYAYNGYLDYAQLLRYNTDRGAATVSPAASSAKVELGSSITIDAGFSVTENVYGIYGATFNLLYSNSLSQPAIKPSVQLATYQETHFSGVPLSEYTNLIHSEDGRDVLQYGVHLTDGAYDGTGAGSLGQFTFTPTKSGTYTFELSDIQLWSNSYSATIPGGTSTVTVVVTEPLSSSPSNPQPAATQTPTAGTAVASGQLTETADPAGGKPSASLAVSDTVLTTALQNAANKSVVLSVSDVDFSKYGQVSIVLTPTQAEKLKASGNALILNGKAFALTIPAGTLPDFITASGLAVTLSLNTEADTALLSGSTQSIDIGASSLTVKNGWKTGKPVLVQLTLNPDGLKDVRKTGVYQEALNNSWTYLQAGTVPADGQLQFSITGDGTYTAASRNTTFSDVGVHWAKDAVEVLAAHGIVAGKGTTASFKPADSLNQAELLTLFDRLLGKGDTWAAHIKESGSRDVLTREEAALILAQALGADGTAAALTFKDAGSISADAKNAIAFAVSKGYLQGVGNNTFNPKGTLTRAQAAVILERVLEDLRNL
ncbi:S8 family serine peptidase [Paenibacillus sp. MMS20-IR301]|uniref:S8 family serine peptidase n=1 Tax=Paenibacillus sp. MMS20-IR301 TaxID=2895946 RepID=UPI0028F0885C|nr:S8 family serine peptidase [Paenibacillus sp. MMS20-IR301]WNS43741.1 S8 family serine peptidase [Paenibacillus sp. MMS20-IR301]